MRLTPLIAVLVASSFARAGVVIVTERKQKDEVRTTTLYVEGSRMRAETQSKRGTAVVIFNGEAEKMTVVEPQGQSYMEMTRADMQAIGTQMVGMRATIEAQMAQLPPEQQKQMRAMMGAKTGPAPQPQRSFKALGRKRTVRGIACETYQILSDQKPTEEACMAAWGKAEVTADDFKGLEKLKDFFGPMMSKEQADDALAEMNKFPGYPVSRAGLNLDGSKEWEEELVSAKRQKIAADKFTVPAGYTRKARPAGRP